LANLKIFVYEHLSGGGLLAAPVSNLGSEEVTRSLLREGSAMRTALLIDLAAIPGVHVGTLIDTRIATDKAWSAALNNANSLNCVGVTHLSEWESAFDRLAQWADAAIVIAPESHGQLKTFAQRVTSHGTALLGPSPEWIALASDKQRLAEYLAACNVPVPHGFLLPAGTSLWLSHRVNLPVVRKPNDGCGSTSVELVEQREQEGSRRIAQYEERIEAFHPGLAASVVLVSGPAGFTTLPACGQRLTNDGRFHYLGGSAPLDQSLNQRAGRLGAAVGKALPKFTGYVGIDLVLGDAADGSQDVVIEVNPRLTTSYVALRAIVQPTPAELMLRALRGASLDWSITGRRIEFDADGTLRER
jgi:predicted ATP-grasp superfamily ATP-dependent carboligase